MSSSRRLVTPPAGFPHWLPTGDSPGGLLYLAWGRRQFGRYPIEPTKHVGWIYVAVLAGAPRLLLGARYRTLHPGNLALIGPDAVTGWADDGNKVSDLLVWVWRRAPKYREIVNPKSAWIGQIDSESMKHLARLHLLTRSEITRPDTWSDPLLMSVQTQLDIMGVRSQNGRLDGSATHEAQLKLAREWMLRHFALRDPLRRLADYLGISSVTLQRLYRTRVGCTPRQVFAELKLAEAQRRLVLKDVSVKQVALELGYRNPGDFSRAYKRQFGSTPVKLRTR